MGPRLGKPTFHGSVCDGLGRLSRITDFASRALLLFLILGITTCIFSSGQALPMVSGQGVDAVEKTSNWFGTMDIGARQFRFYVTIDNSSDPVEATLLSLDEGRQKFALADVESHDQTLKFTLPATKAKYEGKISSDGKSVDGKWLQSGAEFDLDFEQVSSVPEEKLKAYWTGQLDAILQKLTVAFREVDDDTVLFDSISQKIGGFVVKKSVDGNKIILDVPMLKATFEGEQNAEGTEIVGKWKQGPVALDLVLKKSELTEVVATAPKRPQTPQPPFPYKVEDVEVANPDADGVKLSGTLTIPAGTTKHPAVILISGSGPQDRDETIVDHKPFWVIADYLTRRGVAVLRYDDRGVGKSTGDFSSATSADFASDVKALVSFLEQHASIDADRIALCGHSEGGIVAPMVAVEDPQIAALVLLAAPGVTGERVLVSQAKLILEAAGTAADEVEKQLKIQRLMLDLATAKPPLDKEEFKSRALIGLKGLLDSEELTEEEAEVTIEQSAAQLLSPWFRFFLTYDPVDALKKVQCPTLVMNGAKDLQVDPGLNVTAIEAAFGESGFQNYQVTILGGLNHLFQATETGDIGEYAEIEETFNPAALKAMGDWLSKTLNVN